MPSRYRPVSGKARYISPVALTPPDPNTPAAFDPKMAEADTNQSPSPLPPEQESMPRSVGPSDTKARGELLQPQMIDADAGKKLKMSGWNHLKMMPPPGMNHHAAGDVITEPEVGVVGEDGPEVIEPVAGAPDDNSPSVNTDTTPLPPLDSEKKPEKSDRGLKALPESNPGAPPEEPLPQPPPELSQVGGPQAIPTPQAPPAPAPNSLAPKPPSSAQQASAAANAALAKQHEEKPGPAPNNWAQRLALAVLSTTRLAPIANQLIHPKWTEQEHAYESKLGDLQEQQKEAQTAAGTEALIEQREAQAAYREAEAARQSQITTKDPHFGMVKIDPQYAKENLPWKVPDQNGEYWISANVENTLSKPTHDPKQTIVHPGDIVLGDDNKPVYTAPPKPDTEKNLDKTLLGMRAIGKTTGDKRIDDMSPGEAGKTLDRLKENPMVMAAQNSLTPQGIDAMAMAVHTGGSIPAGFSRNPNIVSKIVNRYAELYPGEDIAANKALYTAATGSLTALQKQRDAVVTFENTAGKNLDLFLQQAKPVMDTGSPWINQPIRALDKNLLGSPQLAGMNAARQIALNEIAKVTSNPGLTGQLSDSARKEVEALVPQDASLAQIYHVADVLKKDMENRRTSYDQQLGSMHTALGAGSSGVGNTNGAGAVEYVRDPQTHKLVPKSAQ